MKMSICRLVRILSINIMLGSYCGHNVQALCPTPTYRLTGANFVEICCEYNTFELWAAEIIRVDNDTTGAITLKPLQENWLTVTRELLNDRYGSIVTCNGTTIPLTKREGFQQYHWYVVCIRETIRHMCVPPQCHIARPCDCQCEQTAWLRLSYAELRSTQPVQATSKIANAEYKISLTFDHANLVPLGFIYYTTVWNKTKECEAAASLWAKNYNFLSPNSTNSSSEKCAPHYKWYTSVYAMNAATVQLSHQVAISLDADHFVSAGLWLPGGDIQNLLEKQLGHPMDLSSYIVAEMPQENLPEKLGATITKETTFQRPSAQIGKEPSAADFEKHCSDIEIVRNHSAVSPCKLQTPHASTLWLNNSLAILTSSQLQSQAPKYSKNDGLITRTSNYGALRSLILILCIYLMSIA